ncbi:NADPH:quinone reductase [Solimonas aquatica]|uniref:NADPH:quinone reductase n=1 Tax=Solimonas aquatica TaxID=489703 RepID=A0A1H9MHJ4_9GAMM|nr:NAD(P)-dependent alcohol dehydrogenase [Solimonas aquatica]SER22989.1 NADPH:quinone reductase [Solimonas aquatica]
MMQAWAWQHFSSDEGLQLRQRPMPQAGPGEVLLRVHANSLNRRDLMAVRGLLPRPPAASIVPLCDGAGEIAALGPGVTTFAPGERVLAIFNPRWQTGPLRPEYGGATRGSDVDGLLCEYAVLPAQGVLRYPAYLSAAEAATLPCAAVTAWLALFAKSQLQAGETVLVLGSGAVALFTLQLARAAGARVIMSSSSAQRAERLRALGAEKVFDHRRNDWPAQLQQHCGGADVIVETGGGGSYPQSLQAAAFNARIALVGLISGVHDAGGTLASILFRNLTVRAVQVGSRQDTEAMLRFIESVQLRPIIDSRHSFQAPLAAYQRLESGEAFGKVVIESCGS